MRSTSAGFQVLLHHSSLLNNRLQVQQHNPPTSAKDGTPLVYALHQGQVIRKKLAQ
jgi:hypothetical protein